MKTKPVNLKYGKSQCLIKLIASKNRTMAIHATNAEKGVQKYRTVKYKALQRDKLGTGLSITDVNISRLAKTRNPQMQFSLSSVSIQAQYFFDLGPGDAVFVAVGTLGAFDGPGVFDISDGLTHPAQQSFSLGELLVQLRPVGRRLRTGQNGVTHKYLSRRL